MYLGSYVDNHSELLSFHRSAKNINNRCSIYNSVCRKKHIYLSKINKFQGCSEAVQRPRDIADVTIKKKAA